MQSRWVAPQPALKVPTEPAEFFQSSLTENNVTPRRSLNFWETSWGWKPPPPWQFPRPIPNLESEPPSTFASAFRLRGVAARLRRHLCLSPTLPQRKQFPRHRYVPGFPWPLSCDQNPHNAPIEGCALHGF